MLDAMYIYVCFSHGLNTDIFCNDDEMFIRYGHVIRRSWRSRWTHVLWKIWNNIDTARSTEFDKIDGTDGGKNYDVFAIFTRHVLPVLS
jgi:hypothetical protein